MLPVSFALFVTAHPMAAIREAGRIPLPSVITELVIAAILLILMIILHKRLLRILCLCGTEICLWLSCKMVFGSDALITLIMNWITAAVACVITIVIVNHIDWSSLRGQHGDHSSDSSHTRSTKS